MTNTPTNEQIAAVLDAYCDLALNDVAWLTECPDRMHRAAEEIRKHLDYAKAEKARLKHTKE